METATHLVFFIDPSLPLYGSAVDVMIVDSTVGTLSEIEFSFVPSEKGKQKERKTK